MKVIMLSCYFVFENHFGGFTTTFITTVHVIHNMWFFAYFYTSVFLLLERERVKNKQTTTT